MNDLTKRSKVSWLAVMVLITGAFLFLPAASAEIRLGNKGALAFALDSSVEYDSNVAGNNTEEEDVIGVVRPEILYRFDEGTLNIDAFVGYEVREYDSESQYDSTDFKSGLDLRFPVGEERSYEVRLNGGFNESTATDANLLRVVEKDIVTANLDGRYFFAERYFVRGAARYKDEDFQTDGFSDVEEIALPVDFFYRYNEDLSFGLGYRYRDTDVSGGGATQADSNDHAVYAAVEGRITATIDGDLRVGGQRREFDAPGADDDDNFFAEAALSWDVSDPTVVELKVGQDFETSGASDTVDVLYANVLVRHRFGDKISAAAGLGYEERDYEASERSDEEVNVRLEGDYILIDNRLELRGSVVHATKDSDLVAADYDRTRASLGLRVLF